MNRLRLWSSQAAVRPPRRTALVGLLFIALVGGVLTGCGREDAAVDAAGAALMRTPYPTFTPTPPPAVPAAPAPGAAAAAGGVGGAVTVDTPAGAAGAANPEDAPKAVVNTPLVNARTGPGTDFDIVATVERGAEYTIVAKNGDGTWWQVCCINDAPAWIVGEFVDTDGPVDSVPVAGQTAAAAPETATTAAAPASAAPAATATPAPPALTFDLKMQEQFPATDLVRIFLYVYAADGALEGYSLRVVKNGTTLPVSGQSFAGQPAFTWPFQDARQRYQNFKAEFPGVSPAGTWEVQLVDSSGSPAGPLATFTLVENDPQQELYVRYEQR